MKIRIILQKKNTFFKIFQGIETNPSQNYPSNLSTRKFRANDR